ncbi:cytochrome c [Sulfurimonas lithotrophica]|uniref:Cytochrome c n=1 Tax=Sulfurimonas lithotrophica TaxID=2590022 RepID=A0A5P8P019_9BACT|nr:c-type cytochrome [Sulfurimonas lithotrophica]QFR49065.1 cytochrome c [Sulfurimonas lithotrophica]
MKKLILYSIFFYTSLFAVDGYKVYKDKCASCHIEMISKEKTINNLDKIKAPPMVEVSNRLKENIIIKDDDEDTHRHLVILFIKDYIINPNLDYFMCNAGALERFGVMPSLKGKITHQESQAVAEWIYDRYEGIEFK